MTRGSRAYLGCGAVVVMGLVATAVLMLNVGTFSRLRDGVTVSLPVEDAMGLNVDGDVLVAGVSVGSVRGIALEGDHALLTLQLDRSAGLRADVGARVRMRSLLGEKYVELAPRSQGAPLLAGGERLQPAAPQIDVDEVIAVLGPIIEAVDPSTVEGIADALEKTLAEDPEVLARILRNADAMVADGAALAKDARSTVAQGRQTLSRLDGAVASVRARADQAEGLIRSAEHTLSGIDGVTEPLPATLAKADAAIDDVRAAVQPVAAATGDLAEILENFKDIDEEALRRLLREDGVRVHLFKNKKKKED